MKKIQTSVANCISKEMNNGVPTQRVKLTKDERGKLTKEERMGKCFEKATEARKSREVKMVSLSVLLLCRKYRVLRIKYKVLRKLRAAMFGVFLCFKFIDYNRK